MPVTKYYLDGLELTVYQKSYLVEVRYSESVLRDAEHDLSELPGWIFSPRLAIWLMAEGDSLHARAVQGDAIRNEMMARRGLGGAAMEQAAVA